MITFSVAQWVLYTALLSALIQFIVHVALHRFRVHRRSLRCLFVVAQGNGKVARCSEPRYHEGDHAATLVALAACGYVRPPF
jgi:hypothetical protein